MLGFFLVLENPNEEFDINCQIHHERAKEDIPKEQKELYSEVECTCNVIKSLIHTKKDVKRKYFDKLLSLARVGLVGDTAQPDLSFSSLTKLKEEILIVEGQRIKNDYMKKLGMQAFIISILCILPMLGLSLFLNYKIFNMYLTVFIASMVGTWISFGARKFAISFEQLSIIEEDMMSPIIRLIYIGLCSVVFLLFLNSGIINIQIGGISTAEIKNSFEIQIIIGILCALVESRLGINIYKK